MLAAYDAIARRAGAARRRDRRRRHCRCRFADVDGDRPAASCGSEGYQLVRHELVDDADRCRSTRQCGRASQLGRGITRKLISPRCRARRDEAAFAAALDGIDALLTPTTQTPAVPRRRGRPDARPRRITRGSATCSTCARCRCRTASPPTGLPPSLQIVCRAYDEATALRIGWAYQDATDWHLRHPTE